MRRSANEERQHDEMGYSGMRGLDDVNGGGSDMQLQGCRC